MSLEIEHDKTLFNFVRKSNPRFSVHDSLLYVVAVAFETDGREGVSRILLAPALSNPLLFSVLFSREM